MPATGDNVTPTSPTSCPRCGAAAQGKFCGSCGAPLGPLTCIGCSAPLAPGAKFCHRCGTAAPGGGATQSQAPFGNAVRTPQGNNPTPWIVAGILCVVVIGSIAYSARSQNEPATATMANAGNSVGAPSSAPAGVAPDISNMTPREQFTRLADRIQAALEANDSAKVFQFFPMAEGAFLQLPEGDRDVDARYHMGMLWAQTGDFAKGKGQADTIMKAAPGNLFGYYMYATIAEFQGDSAAARKARADFRDHYDVEIKKTRQEYKDHEPFLDQYRKGAGAK
jgi:hypothetical protein